MAAATGAGQVDPADGVGAAGRVGAADRVDGGVEAARCSSRGCSAGAVWALLWNNPTLHSLDRRKTWAACEVHREHLAGFLSARGFLRDVVPVADAPADPGPARPATGGTAAS